MGKGAGIIETLMQSEDMTDNMELQFKIRLCIEDAVVIDYVMAYYLTTKEGSQFAGMVILDNFVQAEQEYYAVAFRKGSDLVDAFNEVMRDMKADGSADRVAAEYGLQDALVK